jgi:hypothetical protein
LDDFHFLRGAGFNTARIMKYKTWVAIKCQFILDVVDATLEGCWLSSIDKDMEIRTPEEGSTWMKFSSVGIVIEKVLTLPSAACAMHLRIVVFPAFGRPMTSARNRGH